MLYMGNLKMNMPTDDYIAELIKVDKCGNELAVALPFPYIYKYENLLVDASIEIGAQNISETEVKESTGEVSGEMLTDVGATFVLVGHSERRRFKGETNAKIKDKCVLALKNGLKVVLCVGETREDYENGNTSKVLERQLKEILNSIEGINRDNFIIAYEPVWAIGTGLVPSVDEIEVVVRHIKSMAEKWAKSDLKVLYGGSCKATNAKMLKNVEKLDGFLIGGAFLKPDDLQKIIKA